MGYRQDVLPVWNTLQLYEALRSTGSDVPLLCAGDSKMSPEATASPLSHGIRRTWNFETPWSFFQPAARYLGGSGWNAFGFQNASFSTTRTSRDPGQTFTGGETGLFPCNALDAPFTSDPLTVNGNAFSQCVLTDQANFASLANPFNSVQMTARQTFYAAASCVTSVRVRSYRNSNTDASPTYTTVNTSSNINMSTPTGLRYQDVDCGTGANAPGVGVIVSGSEIVETGMNLYLGPPVFYRGTPGARVNGFGLSHIATGGHRPEDLLAVLGGGASPTCSAANVRWYLQNVGFTPKFILVDIGQNLNAGAEVNELNAGTDATFRANYNAILDQFGTLYGGITGASAPFIILINPTRSGYSDLHNETKGRCIFSIAQQRNYGFLDMIQLMPYNGTGNGWWTRAGDDTHYTGPTVPNYTGDGNGSECVAGAMWNAMAGEALGRLRGRSRFFMKH